MPCFVCNDIYETKPCQTYKIKYTPAGKKHGTIFFDNLFRLLHIYNCPCKRCIVTSNCNTRCSEYNEIIKKAQKAIVEGFKYEYPPRDNIMRK